MTVREWDAAQQKVWELAKKIKALTVEMRRIEQEAEANSGLEYHPREAGFPQWYSVKIQRYFDAPRQALEAEEKA